MYIRILTKKMEKRFCKKNNMIIAMKKKKEKFNLRIIIKILNEKLKLNPRIIFLCGFVKMHNSQVQINYFSRLYKKNQLEI